MKNILTPTEQLNSINRSYQMRILSVIAMSFVILGHINFQINGFIETNDMEFGTLNGLFPYYSFHLALFLFISGYFYKEVQGGKGYFKRLGLFTLKKIKNMLIPYYIFSAISLYLGEILRNYNFTFSNPFTIENWLFRPWKKMYVICFSSPSWYLIGLFVAEIYFVLIRGVLSKLIKKEFVRELTLLLLTLAMGVAAALIREFGSPTQTVGVYLRSVCMLFFVQFGVMYKKYWQSYDRLPNILYFAIIILAQLVFLFFLGSTPLNPGLYQLSDFFSGGYTYFIGGTTGLLFWLRISRGLARTAPPKSRFIEFIGSNTKYIMCLHVFGFFFFNLLLEYLAKNRVAPVFLRGFNSQVFHQYMYYAFTDNPRFIPLYFAAAMGFSLFFAWIINLVKKLISSKLTCRS